MIFENFKEIGNILFVNAGSIKSIIKEYGLEVDRKEKL